MEILWTAWLLDSSQNGQREPCREKDSLLKTQTARLFKQIGLLQISKPWTMETQVLLQTNPERNTRSFKLVEDESADPILIRKPDQGSVRGKTNI